MSDWQPEHWAIFLAAVTSSACTIIGAIFAGFMAVKQNPRQQANILDAVARNLEHLQAIRENGNGHPPESESESATQK